LFQLQWRHVAATERSHTLSLGVAAAYHGLAVGISAEQLLAGRNQTTSSGITWADCIYDAHAGALASARPSIPLTQSFPYAFPLPLSLFFPPPFSFLPVALLLCLV